MLAQALGACSSSDRQDRGKADSSVSDESEGGRKSSDASKDEPKQAGDGGVTADDSGAPLGTDGGPLPDSGATDASTDQPLANPVIDSEGDTDLFGADVNGNGVRDDIDTYIDAIAERSDEIPALTAFARELTRMMLLGAQPGTTREAAFGQQVRIVKTIDCLSTFFERDSRRAKVNSIRYAILNNEMRLRAYYAADSLLSGTVLPGPSTGCDPDVVVP